MIDKRFAVALAFIGATALVVGQPTPPPTWPPCYYASGLLELPYAEIKEPFKAYYEAKKNRSRIDYYDFMQTYQIGGDGAQNAGVSYKVAPMSTEQVLNVQTCFQVNGTADAPVTPQAIFPDMTGFQMIREDVYNGEKCRVWQNVTLVGKKRNTYTLYQSERTGLPVRYEMIGYDSLLGSHYDRYYVDYTDVMVQDKLPESVFQVPANLTCGGFPGPGEEEAHRHIVMNPMREFSHHDDSHVEPMFARFKENHGRTYDNDSEHAARQHSFRNNLRYVYSKNRANLGFKLALNHLADLHGEEFSGMRGRKYRPGYMGYNGGLPFDAAQVSPGDIPKQWDWRLYGAVTQVKDQAVCGSCWSFGSTGAVEGAYFLKTGELVRLSQQQLVDCSWGEGNNACDGGEDFRAYQYIMKNGQASEEAYGPYLGADAKCHKVAVTAQMKGYVNVTSGDILHLKAAIAKFGPASVSIDASHRSLSFYANGVYYEPDCGNKLENLDHSVLAVGYGTLKGEDYWLIKNSWSTYWGNDGYVLMSQKDNNCGVATAATYVLM